MSLFALLQLWMEDAPERLLMWQTDKQETKFHHHLHADENT